MLDLTASFEIQTSADSLSLGAPVAASADLGPGLDLVVSSGEMIIEGNAATVDEVAEPPAAVSEELAPESISEPEPEDGGDLLASSLQAAIQAAAAKGAPAVEKDDAIALPTVEIPVPAKGLKIVSMDGEAKVLTPPPVPVESAAPKKESIRPSLTLVKEPAATAAPLAVSPAAKLREKLKPVMERLGPTLGKVFKASAPSADGGYFTAMSRPVQVILLIIALVLGGYGYSMRELHHTGPHAAWHTILKSWQKSDVAAINEVLAIGVEDAALIMVSRYPELAKASESDFGPLIKRFHKARVKAYDGEFRKGFGSAFWEMQMLEMVAFGDRFEVVYGKDLERVVFVLERVDEDWKLVDIDASRAKNMFAINMDEVKGETP